MSSGPDARALQLAQEIVDQLDRLDALGAFAGQDVRENKICYVSIALRNYACERIEQLPNEIAVLKKMFDKVWDQVEGRTASDPPDN